MADLSRKQAPRREIVEVVRVGDWGEVTYRHRLSCGHTEIRKRPSPKTHIACVGCLATRELDRRLADLPPSPAGDPLDQIVDSPLDDLAAMEIEVAKIKAGIATRFQVPLEAVDPVAGPDGIAYVVVFLDAPTARRLSSP